MPVGTRRRRHPSPQDLYVPPLEEENSHEYAVLLAAVGEDSLDGRTVGEDDDDVEDEDLDQEDVDEEGEDEEGEDGERVDQDEGEDGDQGELSVSSTTKKSHTKSHTKITPLHFVNCNEN